MRARKQASVSSLSPLIDGQSSPEGFTKPIKHMAAEEEAIKGLPYTATDRVFPHCLG